MYRSVFTGGIATFPHSTVALTKLKLVNQTAVFWWVMMLYHLGHRHYIPEKSVASIFGVEDGGNRFLYETTWHYNSKILI
jgi:hypothetical protein